ncbi:TPT-domain-containing protein, partial [Gloeopeniophorella convolvens]
RSSELLLRSIIVRVVDYSTHQGFWLALYFVLNLVLTLYNKILLVSLPYPYTLTAVHALFGCLGGSWLRFRNVYRPKALWGTDYLLLIGFSFLYSTNIAVSNVSLDLVTVPFHQIIRATTPIFTTALSWHFLGTHFDRRQMAAIIVVILGVGFATYGDYCFTSWGLALTLAGTILAAVKTMATHAIQAAPSVRHSGPLRRRCYYPYMSFGFLALPTTSLPRLRRYHLQLHPLDLLTRLSTLAFLQCVIYAHISGEMNFVLKSSTACGQTLYLCRMWQTALLFGNGIIACLLNIVSFEANRRSGALSMSVAANVKQALTILCAVWMFRLTITPVNVAGIALTILGGAWYAILECQSKSSRA